MFTTCRIALTFDRHIGSTAAEVPVKFHSDRTILNTNLAASRLYEVLRKDVFSDIETGSCISYFVDASHSYRRQFPQNKCFTFPIYQNTFQVNRRILVSAGTMLVGDKTLVTWITRHNVHSQSIHKIICTTPHIQESNFPATVFFLAATVDPHLLS